MTVNMGSIDRGVRAVIGVVLILLVFMGPQTPWGWIGIIPLATALVGWCPLYSLVGMDTCGGDRA
ncbi:MAG: YgaP family membrane protein [Thiohalospira sp.]|uniref:YgaP family membrane protein n=1 Tax=Thiohalospira sp. TaxID=3080549 RepID=UPI003980F8B3